MRYHDRIKQTSVTTGTGNMVLSGSLTGFQDFADRYREGERLICCFEKDDEWEVSICTFLKATTTLQRDTVLQSSNSDAKTNFSAGTTEIFVTYPASGAGLPYDTVEKITVDTTALPGRSYFVDTCTNAVEITMPLARGNIGARVNVTLTSSDDARTFYVTFATAAALEESLGGYGFGHANTKLYLPGDSVTYVSDGKNWVRETNNYNSHHYSATTTVDFELSTSGSPNWKTLEDVDSNLPDALDIVGDNGFHIKRDGLYAINFNISCDDTIATAGGLTRLVSIIKVEPSEATATRIYNQSTYYGTIGDAIIQESSFTWYLKANDFISVDLINNDSVAHTMEKFETGQRQGCVLTISEGGEYGPNPQIEAVPSPSDETDDWGCCAGAYAVPRVIYIKKGAEAVRTLTWAEDDERWEEDDTTWLRCAGTWQLEYDDVNDGVAVVTTQEPLVLEFDTVSVNTTGTF